MGGIWLACSFLRKRRGFPFGFPLSTHTHTSILRRLLPFPAGKSPANSLEAWGSDRTRTQQTSHQAPGGPEIG